VLFGFRAGPRVRISRQFSEPHIRIANSCRESFSRPFSFLLVWPRHLVESSLGVTVVSSLCFSTPTEVVSEADREIIDNVRMLGASERQLIRHVLIPSAFS